MIITAYFNSPITLFNILAIRYVNLFINFNFIIAVLDIIVIVADDIILGRTVANICYIYLSKASSLKVSEINAPPCENSCLFSLLYMCYICARQVHTSMESKWVRETDYIHICAIFALHMSNHEHWRNESH